MNQKCAKPNVISFWCPISTLIREMIVIILPHAFCSLQDSRLTEFVFTAHQS